MFGLLASGRLPQTDFVPVAENKVMINVPDIDSVDHLAVFLTGQTPLPFGTAAAVYMSWPDAQALPAWLYLGCISNAKPSAIFKISALKSSQVGGNAAMFGVQEQPHIAQIGISVEPEMAVAQLQAAVFEKPNNDEFCKKMLENFFNYAASFCVDPAKAPLTGGVPVVPLSTLQGWYNNYERRLQMNPNFWKN